MNSSLLPAVYTLLFLVIINTIYLVYLHHTKKEKLPAPQPKEDRICFELKFKPNDCHVEFILPSRYKNNSGLKSMTAKCEFEIEYNDGAKKKTIVFGKPDIVGLDIPLNRESFDSLGKT